MKIPHIQYTKSFSQRPPNDSMLVRSNGALERNAQSFMKRTIAAFIGLADVHQDNVSLIGRLSWGRFVSACVGDR